MCYHPFFFPWFGVIFFVVLLLFFFRGRRWHRRWHECGPYYGNPLEKSPENILAERFAKGEIDEKEYNERMGVLKNRAKP